MTCFRSGRAKDKRGTFLKVYTSLLKGELKLHKRNISKDDLKIIEAFNEEIKP